MKSKSLRLCVLLKETPANYLTLLSTHNTIEQALDWLNASRLRSLTGQFWIDSNEKPATLRKVWVPNNRI
jgi:hypothetical protein